MRRGAWLVGVAALAMLANVLLTFLAAPEAVGFRAPLTYRILYYHVPAAWVAYLAFAVTAAAGAWHLWRGGRSADALAVGSAEVGLTFSLVALGTGLVWSRQEFLNYSPWQDAKVITLVVVILAYLAYFALRAGHDEPEKRRRVAAVYGILAFLGVPLSYLASKASVHPDFTRSDSSLDPRLGVYLLLSTVAFTLLYAALVQVRMRLALVERRLEEEES